MSKNTSFYELEFKDSKGKTISMENYKGKTLLIVNTATKCGLAPQFEELEELFQKYKNQNFTVIGFPSNQFANQEPENDISMVSVCKRNFGVTFQLSEKIDVNGKNTHPIFNYLKEHSKRPLLGRKIKWNFTKFLISSDGKIIKRFAPTTKPLKIESEVKKML